MRKTTRHCDKCRRGRLSQYIKELKMYLCKPCRINSKLQYINGKWIPIIEGLKHD